MREFKITFSDDVLSVHSDLKLSDIIKFTDSFSGDLELSFSKFGNDSILMEVTSYEDDFYNSYIIFNNKSNTE